MTPDHPIHPVHRENMHTRQNGRPWRMTASDIHKQNPTLVGYSDAEPNERRLGQFTRHYATMIFAMPNEVRVGYERT